FVDDIQLRDMLDLQFVRSPYAHAEIKNADTSAAEKSPGVVCTLTGAEVAQLTDPFFEIGPEPSSKILDYSLAVTCARYQGEPVAAVVATSRAAAADAAELIEVDYQPLPVVVDAEESLNDQTILHPTAGTNKSWNGAVEYGDVGKAFSNAEHAITTQLLHVT